MVEETNVIKTDLNTSPFVVLFPFVGMANDYELQRVHNKSENKVMFFVKVFVYIYFWLIIVTAWIMQKE